ncbi:taste receptor type 2 member 140 [Rattus norvegicus]|uniref:Taste receptor type 2 member 140 n=1 Tax=Rattus norvegicus TaxID=10116 RepID=TR140_RAT|nr:taste receptor type 2 member 140 [Rattus norvegicus]Q67ES0.1 RecName: Full=Taste receptor type 2 member 140; Short=T2R140; AltName: Full=Taste receptor type 2 member 31; Short=T2R31 [Rattus norvegicus]AAR13359.1 putative taste receptor T2R31 [Rattus norvegicus]|eukprot:NP_001078866.1 taste receptor type 2 member 140 [Rattus norvegicus]
MKVTVECALLITLIVEIIIGCLGNGFIAVVNIMDWTKRRRFSLVDQILTALAISRLAFVWSLLTVLVISELHSSLLITRKMLRIINNFWTVTNHFSIWLATCLSIFYFLKIANFSNSIFLSLRWRVKTVVSLTLLVSLLLLLVNVIIINTCIVISVEGYKVNMSYSSHFNNNPQISRIPLFTNTMFTFIPFTVTLTIFLLLIFSLWRHLKKMQHRAKGPRDPSTTAHIKALQMVVTFLFLYTIFFLALVMQAWNNEIQSKTVFNLVFESIALAFPSGHSCVLILGNSKLRQAFLTIIWWLRSSFNAAELSSP